MANPETTQTPKPLHPLHQLLQPLGEFACAHEMLGRWPWFDLPLKPDQRRDTLVRITGATNMRTARISGLVMPHPEDASQMTFGVYKNYRHRDKLVPLVPLPESLRVIMGTMVDASLMVTPTGAGPRVHVREVLGVERILAPNPEHRRTGLPGYARGLVLGVNPADQEIAMQLGHMPGSFLYVRATEAQVALAESAIDGILGIEVSCNPQSPTHALSSVAPGARTYLIEPPHLQIAPSPVPQS